jgi:hypothetical protein
MYSCSRFGQVRFLAFDVGRLGLLKQPHPLSFLLLLFLWPFDGASSITRCKVNSNLFTLGGKRGGRQRVITQRRRRRRRGTPGSATARSASRRPSSRRTRGGTFLLLRGGGDGLEGGKARHVGKRAAAKAASTINPRPSAPNQIPSPPHAHHSSHASHMPMYRSGLYGCEHVQ